MTPQDPHRLHQATTPPIRLTVGAQPSPDAVIPAGREPGSVDISVERPLVKPIPLLHPGGHSRLRARTPLRWRSRATLTPGWCPRILPPGEHMVVVGTRKVRP